MKLELTIPTDLNEITLGQYQQFIKVKEATTDNEMLAEKMIQIFCGIELKEVVNIKFTEVQKLVEHFNKLFSETPKFTPTFKIKDMEFGFIPDLENISFGEYVDLEENLKSWETYHKAMAVMYRPIKMKRKDGHEIYQYTGTAEFSDLMKFAPLGVVLSSSVFFWNLGSELLQSTIHYLEQEITKNPKILEILAKQHNFKNNGVGINQFMHSLKEMSANLTELPKWDYLNV
jgi:hypothetical protein